MTDDNEPTADELDQLAQTLAIDGSLGRADTLRVVEVLRALVAARRAEPVSRTETSTSRASLST